MNTYRFTAADLDNKDHVVAEIDLIQSVCVLSSSQQDNHTEIVLESTHEGHLDVRCLLEQHTPAHNIQVTVIDNDDYSDFY